jgi:predicted Zn-dependent peptidase
MFKELKLSNGISVILETVVGIKTSIGLLVHCGTRYETPEQNGISHFAEHIQFSGTGTRTKKQLNIDIDNVGETNAYTTKEYAFYYINTVKSREEKAIEIMADMFCNLRFQGQDIEREQKVIHEEIGSLMDRPMDCMYEKAWKNCFGGTGFGLPVIGKTNIIKGFTTSKILKHFDQHYTTDNIVLSVAGNFKINDMVGKLEHYFSGMRKPKTKPPTRHKSILQYKQKQYHRSIEEVYSMMVLKTTPYEHPDNPALKVINEIMGVGFSSRLNQRIREELGLAYSIYSFMLRQQDFGLFCIVSATSGKNYKRLLGEVKKEIKELKHNVTSQTIEDAKSKIILSAELQQDDHDGKIIRNAVKFAFMREPHYDLKYYIGKIKRVTEQDVKEAIEQYLEGKPYSLTIFGNI